MSAITEFKTELMKWFVRYNFEGINDIHFDYDFCYNWEKCEVTIGVVDRSEVAGWFEEFLIEHGCRYEHLPQPLTCFLHEVGHHQTISQFDEGLLMIYHMKKLILDGTMEEKQHCFDYWNIDDELAANEWVVDFINNNIDAVIDLWENVFKPYWERMLSEDNLWILVQLGADNI